MAIYSPRFGYIFFANPQTASKAIARTLERELEGRRLHRRLDQEQQSSLKRLHHLTYETVVQQQLLPEKDLGRLVRVTGVRNPYDLMVSRYLKHRERFTREADRYQWLRGSGREGVQRSIATASKSSLPEWLHAHYGTKTVARDFRLYIDQADMVIRFEALQEDFDALLRRLGVDWPVAVARENVTAQRAAGEEPSGKLAYATFYDDASRDLVGRLFKAVIDRFDYRFDG